MYYNVILNLMLKSKKDREHKHRSKKNMRS